MSSTSTVDFDSSPIPPPDIRSILNGAEPNGLSLEKIRYVTTDDWAEQEKTLGFTD